MATPEGIEALRAMRVQRRMAQELGVTPEQLAVARQTAMANGFTPEQFSAALSQRAATAKQARSIGMTPEQFVAAREGSGMSQQDFDLAVSREAARRMSGGTAEGLEERNERIRAARARKAVESMTPEQLDARNAKIRGKRDERRMAEDISSPNTVAYGPPGLPPGSVVSRKPTKVTTAEEVAEEEAWRRRSLERMRGAGAGGLDPIEESRIRESESPEARRALFKPDDVLGPRNFGPDTTNETIRNSLEMFREKRFRDLAEPTPFSLSEQSVLQNRSRGR